MSREGDIRISLLQEYFGFFFFFLLFICTFHILGKLWCSCEVVCWGRSSLSLNSFLLRSSGSFVALASGGEGCYLSRSITARDDSPHLASLPLPKRVPLRCMNSSLTTQQGWKETLAEERAEGLL